MQKITNFFSKPKKQKLDDQGEKTQSNSLEPLLVLPSTSRERTSHSSQFLAEKCPTPPSPMESDQTSSIDEVKEGDKQWPDCWTLEQKSDFCKKYDWLIVHNKKLGCKVCREVGSLGVEKKLA